MGSVHLGIPREMALAIAQGLELADFVEGGTYRGETASWAAAHFARVISIEQSPDLHALAAAACRHLAHVDLRLGDTRTVLPAVVATLTRPALFWLDSHWSGPGTAGEEAECPLLDEIAAVRRSTLDHVILVDDARYFLTPPPPPHDWRAWPSLDEVLRALDAPGRCWTFVLDDVLYALPPEARPLLASRLQERAALESAALAERLLAGKRHPPPGLVQRLSRRFRKRP
jgi:hypothetical protein